MNSTLIAGIFSMAAGIILTWLMGWARTYLARRIAVSTPTERKVKRLSRDVTQLTRMLDAITGRQAVHAQATIILANAVKIGDQTQVAKSLDLINMAESQYVSFLQSTISNPQEEDDED